MQKSDVTATVTSEAFQSHYDVTAVARGHPAMSATKFTVKFQLPAL